MTCDFCEARAELVQRAQRTERDNRLLRTAVRDLQEERDGEANVSYVLVLLHRIATLEANILKLTERREAKAA